MIGNVANSMEENSGDFICDTLRDYTNADICIINPFSVRSSFQKGKLL